MNATPTPPQSRPSRRGQPSRSLIGAFFRLIKSGIIVFVLYSGIIGYFVGLPLGRAFWTWDLLIFTLGLFCLSAGSFALNQAQEWRIDAVMPRTRFRPIPVGWFSPGTAYGIGFCLATFGVLLLLLLSVGSALFGILGIVLYNGLYTLHWKRFMSFAAVPGAIPGALPVVIGFTAHNPDFLDPRCVFLFMIMFLWQMPHFWCLAIRYRDDYSKGGFPVLPVEIGVAATGFQIGLYTVVYAAVAVLAPLFIESHVFYFVLVVPVAFMILREFLNYSRSAFEANWLRFFLWVNVSLLVFLGAPALDRALRLMWN